MAKEIQHELTFLPDESVIKRAERVGYGKPVSTSNNDLYLTNMALIHVKNSQGFITGWTKQRLNSSPG